MKRLPLVVWLGGLLFALMLAPTLAQDDEAVAVAYLDHVKLQFDVEELVLVRAAASGTERE